MCFSTNVRGQKRGQQWTREEEVALWKLRRQGMQFNQIAASTLRTDLFLSLSLSLSYGSKANWMVTETD